VCNLLPRWWDPVLSQSEVNGGCRCLWSCARKVSGVRSRCVVFFSCYGSLNWFQGTLYATCPSSFLRSPLSASFMTSSAFSDFVFKSAARHALLIHAHLSVPILAASETSAASFNVVLSVLIMTTVSCAFELYSHHPYSSLSLISCMCF